MSTYHALGVRLGDLAELENEEEQVRNHSGAYTEAYTEVVLHLHHFLELAIKDLLRTEHPLLADVASRHPVILHKLLKGEAISTDEEVKTQSIEFGEAKNRLHSLIRDRRIGDGDLDFIVNASALLEEINKLRNRLMHRGIYIVSYQALDQLMGGYVLPFVAQLLSLSEFSSCPETQWKYPSLACGVDPIGQIIHACTAEQYNSGKIAFLKELGRAAYQNPLEPIPAGTLPKERFRYHSRMLRNYERRKTMEHIVCREIREGNAADVKRCPVCGVDSLLVYEDAEPAGDPMCSDRVVFWIYEIKCVCCTLNMDNELGNPSDYGLPIEDYWQVRGAE